MAVEHKLIFTGPVGAGKSTAIASLSDRPVVATDAMASDETRQRKSTTTVAMDYGVMRLDGGGQVHLYGTPGQERFDFMWDILSQGGMGLVLLVDNARPDPLADLSLYVKRFRKLIDERNLVVGVTRMDVSRQVSLASYHQQLDALGVKAPVFEVDARERADVAVLVEALLYPQQVRMING